MIIYRDVGKRPNQQLPLYTPWDRLQLIIPEIRETEKENGFVIPKVC